MHFGKTYTEQKASERKAGEQAVRFLWWPTGSQSGRWYWLQYANCIYIENYSCFWIVKDYGIVDKGFKQ